MPTKAASTKTTTKSPKTAKTTKTAKAATTKTTTAVAAPKTAKKSVNSGYLGLIVEAVRSLHVRGGSSRQAIKSWIHTNRPDKINEDVFERSVRQAIKKGVETKVLIQNGQSFRVNPDVVKPSKKTAAEAKPAAPATPKKAATAKKTAKPVAAAAKKTAAPKKKAAGTKKSTTKKKAATTKK